jgi:hypothetical protein
MRGFLFGSGRPRGDSILEITLETCAVFRRVAVRVILCSHSQPVAGRVTHSVLHFGAPVRPEPIHGDVTSKGQVTVPKKVRDALKSTIGPS